MQEDFTGKLLRVFYALKPIDGIERRIILRVLLDFDTFAKQKSGMTEDQIKLMDTLMDSFISNLLTDFEEFLAKQEAR